MEQNGVPLLNCGPSGKRLVRKKSCSLNKKLIFNTRNPLQNNLQNHKQYDFDKTGRDVYSEQAISVSCAAGWYEPRFIFTAEIFANIVQTE